MLSRRALRASAVGLGLPASADLGAVAAPSARGAPRPAGRFRGNTRGALPDGQAAVQQVHTRAAQRGLGPDRVGFIGLSAGLMTASRLR